MLLLVDVVVSWWVAAAMAGSGNSFFGVFISVSMIRWFNQLLFVFFLMVPFFLQYYTLALKFIPFVYLNLMDYEQFLISL